MNFSTKVKERYREGLLLNTIYSGLKAIEVNLFYLFQENLDDVMNLDIQSKIEPIEIEHLKPSDMRYLAMQAERDYSEDKMLRMLSEGCKCMGTKYKGKIVSYGWYDLQNCKSKRFSFSFELKANEAYFYGIRTLSAFKGKGLAPCLRYHTYKYLAEIGRTRFYSLILFSNIPSIKFHRKLNDKPLKLFMNVRYLGKFNRNILLKRYKN
jgi:hypothetical protein